MKRFLFLAFSILCSFGLCAQQHASHFDDFFDGRALRLDYHRIGNAQSDSLAFVRFVRCGSWAGTRTALVDPFDNGPYRVEMRDYHTGRLLFSHYYGSLFNEYCATALARDSVVSFDEVLLLPCPRSEVFIVLSNRLPDNSFTTRALWHFNPNDSCPLPSSPASSCDTLLYRGDPSSKVDVVIVADGYRPDEAPQMRLDMRRLADSIFTREPFLSRRNDFNIFGVSGAAGTHGGIFGVDRYFMTFDLFRLYDIIGSTPCDFIVIMYNTHTYGGGAIYNFYAVTTLNDMFSSVLPHELGHSMGGLADEYVAPDLSFADIHRPVIEPTQPNVTSLVDFQSKWADMLPPSTPIPTPPVSVAAGCGPLGVYEGAAYQPQGFFRPTMHCMMRDYAPFCPVCRRRLEAIFNHLVGLP